jgi:hypothetical protein
MRVHRWKKYLNAVKQYRARLLGAEYRGAPRQRKEAQLPDSEFDDAKKAASKRRLETGCYRLATKINRHETCATNSKKTSLRGWIPLEGSHREQREVSNLQASPNGYQAHWRLATGLNEPAGFY